MHFASGTDVFLAVAPLCERVSIHKNCNYSPLFGGLTRVLPGED